MLIGGDDVTSTRAHQRPVNTVFQSYALFPHLDVTENVAFGLRRKGIRDAEQQAMEALDLVELRHLARRKPTQLSGGQQQRVALARAIVNHPAVLLLDEPLGALDLKLRRQMQVELKRIQDEVGLTFVHVTHDQEEAMTMADTVAVMNAGRIEQMGAPQALYDLPRTAFVANFLGRSNLVPGTVVDRGGRGAGCRRRRHPGARPGRPRGQRRGRGPGRRPAGEGAPGHRRRGDARRHQRDRSRHGPATCRSPGSAPSTWSTSPGLATMSVFAQNLDAVVRASRGDQVRLAWLPRHTFGLAGDEDSHAGQEVLDRDAADDEPATAKALR